MTWFFLNIYFFTLAQVVEVVGGGSVIKGDTPSSLLNCSSTWNKQKNIKIYSFNEIDKDTVWDRMQMWRTQRHKKVKDNFAIIAGQAYIFNIKFTFFIKSGKMLLAVPKSGKF